MSLRPPNHRLSRRSLPALSALVLACAAAGDPAAGPVTAPAGLTPGGASGAAPAAPGAAASAAASAVPADKTATPGKPAIPSKAALPISEPAASPRPSDAKTDIAASHPPAEPAAAIPIPATASAIAPDKKPAPADPAKPREIDGLTRLAVKLADRGDYATAEIAYWQILSRPDLSIDDEKTTLLALAHLLRKEGQQTRAAAIYEKFVKDYADDDRIPEALLELGRTLRDMGTYKLAISRFYSVINSTLKFPTQGLEHYEQLAKTAQFEIAQTHFDAGDYEEAGKYFTRVRLLDLAPVDRARATFMAAVSQNRAGETDTAIATLKTYLIQFPNDENVPEARYLLATTLREHNRPQDALAVTLELLKDERSRNKSDPRRWSYWQQRTGNQVANDFFQTGDTFNALAIYKGLIDLSTEPSWRLSIGYQIALCYERLRQLDAARTAYKTIVSGATPQAGGPAVSAEITELGQMAAWRLAQLAWRDHADQELNALLPPTDGPPPPPPPATRAAPTSPPAPTHPS